MNLNDFERGLVVDRMRSQYVASNSTEFEDLSGVRHRAGRVEMIRKMRDGEALHNAQRAARVGGGRLSGSSWLAPDWRLDRLRRVRCIVMEWQAQGMN